MMQLNCLILGNIGMTYRVLHQYILHSPTPGGTRLAGFFKSLFRPCQQTVKDINKGSDYDQSKRSQLNYSVFLLSQAVFTA